jgi:hypothetical protein
LEHEWCSRSPFWNKYFWSLYFWFGSRNFQHLFELC